MTVVKLSLDSGLDHQYHPALIRTHKYIDDSIEPLLIVVWITSIIQLRSGHTNIFMTAVNLSPDSGLDHQ